MWLFPRSQQSSWCTFRDGGSLTPRLTSAASPKISYPCLQEEMLFQVLSGTLWAEKKRFFRKEEGSPRASPPFSINFQAHVALAVLQPTQALGKAKPKHTPGGQSLETPRVNTPRCGLQHPPAKTPCFLSKQGSLLMFHGTIKSQPHLSEKEEGRTLPPDLGRGRVKLAGKASAPFPNP